MNDNSVLKAKQDLEFRNQLIIEKTPFVIYMVSQTLGRYVETENDIEFLVGLEALNDAIDKYDPTKGAFESFAGVVIKNKVLDEVRKNARHERNNIYDAQIDDISDADVLDLKIELNEFKEVLDQYQLNFDDMVSASPIHEDTRKRALKCAMTLSEREPIVTEIKAKKKLPISLLVKSKLETRRFLYAHQKYILFSSLAFIHRFTQITGWINEAIGGERDDVL